MGQVGAYQNRDTAQATARVGVSSGPPASAACRNSDGVRSIQVATALQEVTALLKLGDGQPFRSRGCEHAARIVESLGPGLAPVHRTEANRPGGSELGPVDCDMLAVLDALAETPSLFARGCRGGMRRSPRDRLTKGAGSRASGRRRFCRAASFFGRRALSDCVNVALWVSLAGRRLRCPVSSCSWS